MTVTVHQVRRAAEEVRDALFGAEFTHREDYSAMLVLVKSPKLLTMLANRINGVPDGSDITS